jgi:hypothetical protein
MIAQHVKSVNGKDDLCLYQNEMAVDCVIMGVVKEQAKLSIPNYIASNAMSSKRSPRLIDINESKQYLTGMQLRFLRP